MSQSNHGSQNNGERDLEPSTARRVGVNAGTPASPRREEPGCQLRAVCMEGEERYQGEGALRSLLDKELDRQRLRKERTISHVPGREVWD